MKSIRRSLFIAVQITIAALPVTVVAQNANFTTSFLTTGTFGTSPALTGTANNNPGGPRMLWYPRKAAFRAGSVSADQWTDSFIGNYSVALGQNTTASGANSTAFGNGARASQSNSTAFGVNSIAAGAQSTAFGNGTTATGDSSTSIGVGTKSGSYAATAIGRYNTGLGSPTAWNGSDPVFEIGNGTSASTLSNAFTVLKNGNTSIAGSLSASGSISTAGSITSSSISTTNLSAAVITSNGQPVITSANLATSLNALPQVNLSGNSDVSGSLDVGGDVYLGASPQALTGLPSQVTGTCYGSVRTGNGAYQHDLFFLSTGDENTADCIIPLGYYINNGAEIKVDIATRYGDPDAGSAHYTLVGKLHGGVTNMCGDLTAIEHRAAGGATNVELYGRNSHGYTFLYLKFDAKNYSPGEVYDHGVEVKIVSFGPSYPKARDGYTFADTYLIEKVESTTRPNNESFTKLINADEIRLNGKVTLTVPQGDISMGIYQ